MTCAGCGDSGPFQSQFRGRFLKSVLRRFRGDWTSGDTCRSTTCCRGFEMAGFSISDREELGFFWPIREVDPFGGARQISPQNRLLENRCWACFFRFAWSCNFSKPDFEVYQEVNEALSTHRIRRWLERPGRQSV